MKLPDRKPRKRESYHLGLSYHDAETAVQEDGRIAQFEYNSDYDSKGWQFRGYVDKYGFAIWEEEDHKKMWNDKITIEQLLLESVDPDPYIHSWEKEKIEVADDEELHAYSYGGCLAQRGGWFVVKKNNPKRIIRSRMTWMS